MTGEPVSDESGRRWLHHDREHEAAEKAHRREHDSDQRAIKVAVDGVDRRLDDLNQLRKEVITDRSQFVQAESYASDQSAIKLELRSRHESLGQRIDAVEKLLDRAEGAANTWRWLAGFLGLGGIGTVIWAITQAPK